MRCSGRSKTAERAVAVAAHVVSVPIDPSEQAVGRNAERQLQALEDSQLTTVGLLTCSDIFSINVRLRRGWDLNRAAPVVMDGLGIVSMQQFVAGAQQVVADLGGAITLDEPVRLFRGIGLPVEPDDERPDIAGIAQHLLDKQPWQNEFTDLGFGFATTDPLDAAFYGDQDLTGGSEGDRPVLLQFS